jgi:hypothetical protein
MEAVLRDATFKRWNSPRPLAFWLCLRSRHRTATDRQIVVPLRAGRHPAENSDRHGWGTKMRGHATIDEEDLHAYIDGALDRERRFDVALYLAHHPADAARAEAYRAQREGISALFDDVLDQPPPDRLRRTLRRPRARAASRR